MNTMGFFDRMMDEAGKKTGKAIGNKLYGKYADDYRVVFSGGGDGTESAGSSKAAAKIEAKSKEKELEMQMEMFEKKKDAELMKELRELQFNASDIDYNINVLTQLVSLMESMSSKDNDSVDNDSKESIISLASSKFDTGLAICRSINPNNAMVVYFTQKKQDILAAKEAKVAAAKKSKRITWLIILGLIIVPLLLMMIFSAIGS
ncbi:MAG: hypothetical protein IJL38_06430 [Bacteroidales bacterium]|nr:hypothetical protein [Bacteroidales bacterium]